MRNPQGPLGRPRQPVPLRRAEGPGERTMPLPQQAYSPSQRPAPPEPRAQQAPPPRRRGPAVSLWILGVVVVGIAGLVVSALGFVNPGWFMRTVFNAGSVQLGVQQVLRDSYDISDVQSVTCPPGEPVQVAETFACTVVIGQQSQTVTISVQNASGTYQVSRPH